MLCNYSIRVIQNMKFAGSNPPTSKITFFKPCNPKSLLDHLIHVINPCEISHSIYTVDRIKSTVQNTLQTHHTDQLSYPQSPFTTYKTHSHNRITHHHIILKLQSNFFTGKITFSNFNLLSISIYIYVLFIELLICFIY